MSSRKLLVLLDNLPPDSAYQCARLTGDRWPEWVHLLAYLADNQAFARREAQGEDSSWNPKPVPRPMDAVEADSGRKVMRNVHDALMASMKQQ